MRSLNEIYGGRVVAVNLIDTKGDQKMLGDAYRVAVERSAGMGSDVEYVWFDFHKECRKMRYDRLAHLLDNVSRSLVAIGCVRPCSLASVMIVCACVLQSVRGQVL